MEIDTSPPVHTHDTTSMHEKCDDARLDQKMTLYLKYCQRNFQKTFKKCSNLHDAIISLLKSKKGKCELYSEHTEHTEKGNKEEQ